MSCKMKTKSSAAKRFKVTGSGRIKFNHTKMRHILAKKGHKVKRHLRHAGMLRGADAANVKALVPYL
jgi:large subunit ribosomal protein L35